MTALHIHTVEYRLGALHAHLGGSQGEARRPFRLRRRRCRYAAWVIDPDTVRLAGNRLRTVRNRTIDSTFEMRWQRTIASARRRTIRGCTISTTNILLR